MSPPRLQRPPHALVATAALLVLLLAACGGKADKAGGRAGGGAPAVVTTTVLAPQPWTDTIAALGTARARESVEITAKVSDTVAQVNFDSGQSASAGQVLVRLSNAQESAAVRQAQATYSAAQTLYARQEGLAQKQLIATSTLDAQRAIRDAAKANLDELGANASDRVIRAPFAGVLGLRRVSPGSLVSPGTVITTLDDLSALEVDFSLPERALGKLAVGQRVQATSDAFPGERFDGAIASIDTRIDPPSPALAARARFDNPDARLRPGMLLQVVLDQPVRQALQVPELSLQQVGQQSFVFLVGADDKVEQVPVTLGARRPGWIEILDGVKAGDRVVVEGIVKLKPGAKIIDAAKAGADGVGARAGDGTRPKRAG
jgi:membrane fusion protein (multidrug efflux system)